MTAVINSGSPEVVVAHSRIGCNSGYSINSSSNGSNSHCGSNSSDVTIVVTTVVAAVVASLVDAVMAVVIREGAESAGCVIDRMHD